MEKWNLYTIDRVITNRVITRGDDIPKNLYHLVVNNIRMKLKLNTIDLKVVVWKNP